MQRPPSMRSGGGGSPGDNRKRQNTHNSAEIAAQILVSSSLLGTSSLFAVQGVGKTQEVVLKQFVSARLHRLCKMRAPHRISFLDQRLGGAQPNLIQCEIELRPRTTTRVSLSAFRLVYT